jgi:hypothetical protein
VAATDFARRHGCRLTEAFGSLLVELAAQGLVEWCGDCLIVPAARRYLLDSIVVHFLPEPAVTG